MAHKETIVYIPGVWDMLHVGHVAILERAKSIGDKLIVGVPTDEVVIEDKGRPPIITCADRAKMLNALKCVDLAVPYDKLEFINALKRFDVDILVTGSTWGSDKRHIESVEYMKNNGKRVIQFPYTNTTSTTDIKRRVIECMGAGQNT